MPRDPDKHWESAIPRDEMLLRPLHWSELAHRPRQAPLVKRLLDLGGKSILYGDSNCGKTFLALDIACHVALGWPWRDLRVRQCRWSASRQRACWGSWSGSSPSDITTAWRMGNFRFL